MTYDAAAALAAQDLAQRALADIGQALQHAFALNERAAAAQFEISTMLTRLVIPHRWAGTRLEIEGPDGYVTGPDLQGRPGTGTPGKSAHQLWLDAGNTGTVADYLAAMRGESFRPNAIGPIALRGQFDDELHGFAYLASDEERLYFRVGSESGEWSDGVVFGRGEPGLSPEIGVGDGQVRWRLEGEGVWRDLVSVASLAGKDGREVQIRATATHLQWRYAGDAAWTDMVVIADLQAAANAAVASIVTARDAALGAVAEAAGAITSARDSALGAISSAAGPVTQAAQDAAQAAEDATGAAAQAQWSRLWADAPPDTPVDDGVNPPGYSARHWAGKASEAAEFDPDTYLTKAGNLSGLQDKAAARQALDLKSAATAEASAFATAAQGTKADSALQPAALDGYALTSSLPGAATQSAAGLMSADDKTKLDGVSAGAKPGTVTSVGAAPPAGMEASGAVTTSGTIALTWSNGYRAYTDVEAAKLAGLAAQVPADWTATTGPARVLNKPSTFPPAMHGHPISEVTDLAPALAAKAPLASPAFTGTPTAPTQTAGTAGTSLATTKFVADAIAALINGAPGALDTLTELAAALGGDPNFATTVTNALAGKLSKASNLGDLTDVAAARLALQLGSAALQAATAFATAAQGTKADSAVQPAALNAYALASALSTVATSGSYNDLSNRPSIPPPVAIASAATIRAGTNDAEATGVKSTWDAHAPVTVNLAALDMATFINGIAAVNANTTVANPMNTKAGQNGVIEVTITGTRTLTWGSAWRKAAKSPAAPTTGSFLLTLYVASTGAVVYAIAEM